MRCVSPVMVSSQTQIRQAVDDLIRRFGDRVPVEVIQEAAAAAHLDLRRTATCALI